MSTDGNAPGLAVPHRAVNSRFVRADSVIRRGEYAVNPAMGAIRQSGEYVANTWRISDVVVAAITVTGVATTRGDRDNNCDRGDGFRHSHHGCCDSVTVCGVTGCCGVTVVIWFTVTAVAWFTVTVVL